MAWDHFGASAVGSHVRGCTSSGGARLAFGTGGGVPGHDAGREFDESDDEVFSSESGLLGEPCRHSDSVANCTCSTIEVAAAASLRTLRTGVSPSSHASS